MSTNSVCIARIMGCMVILILGFSLSYTCSQFDNTTVCLFFQPTEDISVVSWNRQVQHILASANPSGKAVVWDLRKNEPIIKISDHSNRVGDFNTKYSELRFRVTFCQFTATLTLLD